MRTETPPRRLRRVVIASLLTALTLAGCSAADGGDSAATSAASPTSADSGATSEPTETGTAAATEGVDPGATRAAGQDAEDDSAGPASSGRGETEAPVTVTTAAEPTAVGEFDYEDVPEPAPQEVQTLCNLTQDFFVGQRNASLANGRVSENMQLTVVALSDQVGIWTGLQESYPDAAEDIRRAEVILQHWDNALAASQQGLVADEQAYLAEADALIEQLPPETAAADVGCAR